MADVVAIGDVNVDFLMSVERYPDPGGCAISQASTWQVGGSASNAAILLNRLGLDTAMIGRVGVDPLASWVTTQMVNAGIDMAAVGRDDDTMTGFCVIPITPDGERTMFTERGANERLSAEALDGRLIASAQWLHVSGYLLFTRAGRTAFAEAIDRAQRANVPVSVDVGIGIALEGHQEQLQARLTAIDVLLADEAELAILTGEDDPKAAARIARGEGTRTVIVKRGAAGCRAATDDDEWTLPALEVEPVDATGAGDAFSAGVIAGRLEGLDWRSAVWLANALGGLSVRCHGAGRALPDRAQIINAIQAQAPSDEGSHGTVELATLIERLENLPGNDHD